MSHEHEHEHSHTRASAADVTPNDTAEPGQSSQSALLHKPKHAIASGLVQLEALMQIVARHAGKTIAGGGGFSYTAHTDATFEITTAPTTLRNSLHRIIAPVGHYAEAWKTLVHRLVVLEQSTNRSTTDKTPHPALPSQEPASNVDERADVPPKVPSRLQADEREPAQAEGQKPDANIESNPQSGDDSKPDKKAALHLEMTAGSKIDNVEKSIPAVVTPIATGDVRYCVSDHAWIRDATGKPLAPQQVVPQHSYVRALETSINGKMSLVRVAALPSNQEIGWIAASNLMALVRPKRPSSAAAQMAALVAAATTNAKPDGRCYAAIKHHIKEIGGYGDILDPYADERFQGLGGSAVMFAQIVAKYGAHALGLEEVGGLPKDAPAGTLLVTRGNDKIKISKKHGDIAVISHVEKGCVIAYNDGRMKLVANPKKWDTDYQGVLVGMYKPIDRE
ncbi:MAG TPA: hypothetical protein VN253_21950 [Kofleriaceae bacterium]|nr:hypothetical protein [Kofleriaceae bacterium]